MCTVATKTKTCTQVAVCAWAAAECIEDVAKTASNTSTCLSAVQSVHTAAMGTGLWNETAAYTDCSNAFCHFLNISVSTTTAGTCADGTSFVQAAKNVCKYGPISVQASFKFGSGNFSAIVSNSTAKTAAMDCIETDLENHLRYPVNVYDIVITDAATGAARVDFEVYAPASQWEAKLASADGNANWLICFNAAKFAQYGGTGTFGAPTFSVATPTPSPPTTPGTTPTPATPPPASASMMWSAVQIIVAVVAVLVIA